MITTPSGQALVRPWAVSLASIFAVAEGLVAQLNEESTAVRPKQESRIAVHEYTTGVFLLLAGVGMILLRSSVALLQASAVGLVLGMDNAKKLIPILKVEVLIGGLIFAGIGVYSTIRIY